MDRSEFDVFISYARRDDVNGWVSQLRDAVCAERRVFDPSPFPIFPFFDREAIHSGNDWRRRLRQGLRSSRVLLVCLSPNYLQSEFCRWEWEEFARLHVGRTGTAEPVTGVIFAELGEDSQYATDIAAWRHEYGLESTQLENLQDWFDQGPGALQQAEVRARVKELGRRVYRALRSEQMAQKVKGNLRRNNPLFVGRKAEINELSDHLFGGREGCITALCGVGGMGKTELAVTYAHRYAPHYQGGIWHVEAEKHTSILAAIATLAPLPKLGLKIGDSADSPEILGRKVLDRLAQLTQEARAEDPAASVACLLLLDNVSEKELLSEPQIAKVDSEGWLHILATTRLGSNEIGGSGPYSSVTAIEIDRLNADDALALLREYQPPRDVAGLHPDFSSSAEEDAAREIVSLLEGWTLVVEQAAVYLGTKIEPTKLLPLLRSHSVAILDDVARNTGEGIRHEQRLVGVIVDQTLQQLPSRARDALGVASLLPPDTIPWEWLEELTTALPSDRPILPGAGFDDWLSVQRLLEGRRLLTQLDNPRFAGLHRDLGDHLRNRLVDADTEQRVDDFLARMAHGLAGARKPERDLLIATSNSVTKHLSATGEQPPSSAVAEAGAALIDSVQARLDSTTAYNLASAVLQADHRLAAAAGSSDTASQGKRVKNFNRVADLALTRGDANQAFSYYTRAVASAEKLVRIDPSNAEGQRYLSIALYRLGDVLGARGDVEGAMECCLRAVAICEAFSEPDSQDADWLHAFAAALTRVGDFLSEDTAGVMQERYVQSRASAVQENDAAGDALDYRAEVLKCYAQSLAYCERLVELKPDDMKSHRDVLLLRDRVANITYSDDAVRLVENLEQTLNQTELLVDADNDDRVLQLQYCHRLYGIALQRMANRDVLARGSDATGLQSATNEQLTKALQYLDRAIRIAEDLVKQDSSDTGALELLADALNRAGDVCALLNDSSAALRNYTAALDGARLLVKIDPFSSRWRQSLRFALDDARRAQAADGGLGFVVDGPPWPSWQPCPDGLAEDALEQLACDEPGAFAAATIESCRYSRLLFYTAHQLLELTFTRSGRTERAFVLHGAERTMWLDGDSDPIYVANETESIVLTESTCTQYLQFFCHFLRAEGGAFVLVESVANITLLSNERRPSDDSDDPWATLETARSRVHPLRMRTEASRDVWRFDATIAHEGALFAATLQVKANGEVEMIDDEPICVLDGLAVSKPPSLGVLPFDYRLRREREPGSWADWDACEGVRSRSALERLAVDMPQFFAKAVLISGRWSRLPFYKDHRLMDLTFSRDGRNERAFVLHGRERTLWLNGTASTIHQANGADPSALSDETVADYVRFFFYFLRANEGAFVLIESGDDIDASDDPADSARSEADWLSLESARENARPVTLRGRDDTGRWLLDAVVSYAGQLFHTSVGVGSDGDVEMIDDSPIGALGELIVVQPPTLMLAERQSETQQPMEFTEARKPWISWERCSEVRATDVLRHLADSDSSIFVDCALVSAHQSRLPFYEELDLIELGIARDGTTEHVYALDGPGGTAWLNGESAPIHDANDAASLVLSDVTFPDYVRFFFYFLRGEQGPFVLIEDGSELAHANHTGTVDNDISGEILTLDAARSRARPLRMDGRDSNGGRRFDVTFAYSGCLYNSTIVVSANGEVAMTGDEMIGALGPLVVAHPPSLSPMEA